MDTSIKAILRDKKNCETIKSLIDKEIEQNTKSFLDKIKGGMINSETEIRGQGSGGARVGAGRKPSATTKAYKKLSPEEKKAREEARAITRKLIKEADKARAKEKADKKIAKAKKREANKKPYFKADEPKKGFREASMLEASKNKKILLWGKKKADPKIVAEQFQTGKPLKERRAELQLKFVSKKGILSRLDREIKALKDGTEARVRKIEEYQREFKLASEIQKELVSVNEKIKLETK